MKGSVGAQTRIGTILPGAAKIVKIRTPASKQAALRLKWINFYRQKKNARATCRHFGISPSLFYKWLNRYERFDLKGLEELSRRPQKVRRSNIPLGQIDLVRSLRKRYPYFSKYKTQSDFISRLPNHFIRFNHWQNHQKIRSVFCLALSVQKTTLQIPKKQNR